MQGKDEPSGKRDGLASSERGAVRGFRQTGGEFSDYWVKTRPAELETKQGTKGMPMKMITNFYKLKKAPQWTLYEYHMVTSPSVDHVPTRKYLLRQHKDTLGGYIFDGMKLYMSKKLPSDNYVYQAELEKEKTKHTVTLVFHHALEPGDPTYMHFYHLILRRCLYGMELEEIGRHFYDHKSAIKLEKQRLELWPGYITSLRQHEKDVLLCIETTHKVLRMDNVLTIIRQIESSARGDPLPALQAQLNGTIVMTMYNRKTYKIDDVTVSSNPLTTFEGRKGEPTTLKDYFKTKYGLNVTDDKQPLIVVRPSKRDEHAGRTGNILLIPEFCQLTGLTDQMRENFTLMKELAKYLHVGPNERVKEIQHFRDRLADKLELSEHLKQWGLQFEQNLTQVDGRSLPPEKIIFAGAEFTADSKADWTMAFRSQKMLTAVNLAKWVVIVPQRDAGGVDNLVKLLIRVSSPLNMRISNPLEVHQLPQINGAAYVKAINVLVEKYKDIQMLFVILPNNKPDTYAMVKKRLAVDFGILSQCFVAKNLQNKGLMSICTKIVVQMNSKLGGEPWSIKLPLKKLMVVGFDVYHGGIGSKKSVAAMVSTVSGTLAKYFSTTTNYTKNNSDNAELSKAMVSDFTKCLSAYAAENGGELPDRIILFRDGVGEGQVYTVFHSELQQLLSCMKDVYGKRDLPPPKFSFIIVTKKINSRFMLDKGGKYDNPAPGSIVDDVITIPERYDFFLVSCTARQGTVSPCCYNVIYDTQGLDPDKIQMITYKMCHMYFNWSGTVAVPAPCQYAHKLASISGISYQGTANEKLSKLLHFL